MDDSCVSCVFGFDASVHIHTPAVGGHARFLQALHRLCCEFLCFCEGRRCLSQTFTYGEFS